MTSMTSTSGNRTAQVENAAQGARHTTGEWLTWALDAVEDPRAEFESAIREIVSDKMDATRRGADELMKDTASDRDGDGWNRGGRAA
ncbi:MAG: hypothetical protein IT436_18715 [Phycisphaerales bacterium]|nr:hypothetical protein [Phycisphaerales bacterium]